MKNNIILIAIVTILSLAIIITVILISTSGKENDESESIPVISLTEESDPPDIPNESDIEPSSPTEESPAMTTPDTSVVSVPTEEPTDEPQPSAGAAEVVALAHTLLGVEFAEGGDTPAGFDNSGFIYYVLRENGYITCPRGVSQQAEMGTRLEYDELLVGDLVFFYNESGTGAGFGGIYIGSGKMIACLMPGTVVKEVDITTEYYRNNFYQGVSLSG